MAQCATTRWIEAIRFADGRVERPLIDVVDARTVVATVVHLKGPTGLPPPHLGTMGSRPSMPRFDGARRRARVRPALASHQGLAHHGLAVLCCVVLLTCFSVEP